MKRAALHTALISTLLAALAATMGGTDPIAVGKDVRSAALEAGKQPASGIRLRTKPDSATDPEGIHNLVLATEQVLMGSEPHGEQGFSSLASLGVKTIVSVDGAKPDVATARRHGLRYIHIPLGYDGVPTSAAESLARVAKDVEGPIYVHCHHGKHRGPAAAAIVCLASGDLSNQQARELLQLAGTSRDYQGLWRDVQRFQPPPPNAELPELVEIADVGSFTAAMAQADRAFDNLEMIRDAQWLALADHPDIAPEQEALLLVEGLHEAGRNAGDYDERFRAWLGSAENDATSLRSSLRDKDLNAASHHMLRIEKACTQCHQRFRDK